MWVCGLFGFWMVVEEDIKGAALLSPSGTPSFLKILGSGKGIQVRNFNNRIHLTQ